MKDLVSYILESQQTIKFKSDRSGNWGTGVAPNGDRVEFQRTYTPKGEALSKFKVEISRDDSKLGPGQKKMFNFNIGDFEGEDLKLKDRKLAAEEVYTNWLKDNPALGMEMAEGTEGEIVSFITDNGIKPTPGKKFSDEEVYSSRMSGDADYFKTIGEVEQFLSDNYTIEVKKKKELIINHKSNNKLALKLFVKGKRVFVSFDKWGQDTKGYGKMNELFYHLGVALHAVTPVQVGQNIDAWSSGKHWAGTEW